MFNKITKVNLKFHEKYFKDLLIPESVFPIYNLSFDAYSSNKTAYPEYCMTNSI